MPRHQHTAVDRNRLKRRLRELVRLELLPALRSPTSRATDILIRARRDAYTAPLAALRSDIETIRNALAATR